MYWLIPLAIVLAAAWAVRWQFRESGRPQPTDLQVTEILSLQSDLSQRRAA